MDENGKRVNITRQGFKIYNGSKLTYDQLRANGTTGYQKPKQIKRLDTFLYQPFIIIQRSVRAYFVLIIIVFEIKTLIL